MSFELKNKLIVLIANEPWGDIWYSKHNYAFELSKNNTVVFVNPAPTWKTFNAFKAAEIKEHSKNLFVLDYYNYFPIIGSGISKLNNYFCSRKLNAFLKNHFSKSIDVFWTFDPHRLFIPKLFSPTTSIFHVVDRYAFKFFGEKLLASNCDLVIVVSKLFENQYTNLNKNILHIPHGINNEQFSSAEKPTLKYDGIYVGNIDLRINFKLLEAILISFPEKQFLFVGKFYGNDIPLAKAIFIDKKYPNLNWIGIKPFNELKNLIAKSSFCLSIMDASYPGNDIAHHKTLQYLAFGKPIFGSIFKDYSDIPNLLYQTNNDEELIKKMKSFFENNEAAELASQRIEYAKRFTYEKHIQKIENTLNTLQK